MPSREFLLPVDGGRAQEGKAGSLLTKGHNSRASKHPGAESGRLRWIEGHFDPCILVSLAPIFYLKNLLIPLRPW